ncbi:MAG TPA: DUF424 family protein [Methanothrix sp.]|nr:DUF424 family protein [Methanothrix sp.]HOK57718.1 DUF424 family protein [Methanothrix sp.]HOL43121.1 DUF424 family protein [Methanothrix sp.]HPO88123.1 DUF424 family protein [Methanothrix sp.]
MTHEGIDGMMRNDRAPGDYDEMSMCLRTYTIGREVLVAVCDSELLGQRFTENELQLEVSASFFGQELASAAMLERALEEATMANFVGERAVAWAIAFEYVDRENVLHIDGVPCAQMVRM